MKEKNAIKKLYKRESGFTLIELLVVIGIIAVLATIGTISFGNAASKARDTKRQSDLRTILSGLQIYNTRVGVYPPGGTDTASTWADFSKLLGVSGVAPPKPATEDYCYWRGQELATDPVNTLYFLVATGFENTIPNDAVTYGTTNALSLVSDDNDTVAATLPICNDDDAGQTAIPTLNTATACTVAGTNGGGNYCIKGATGSLF